MILNIRVFLFGFLLMVTSTPNAFAQFSPDTSAINKKIKEAAQLNNLRKYTKALPLGHYIIGKSNKIGYMAGAAHGFYQLANTHEGLLNIDSAVYYMTKAESIFKMLKLDKELANTYTKLGDYFRIDDRNDTSVLLYNKATQIAEHLHNTKMLSDAYYGLGRTFVQLGKYKAAMNLYVKVLGIRETLDDVKGVADVINSIGIVFKTQGDLGNALEFQLRGIEMRKKLQDSTGLAYQYNNLGIVYRDLNNYEKAFECFNKSIEIKQKINDIRGLSNSYMNKGSVFILQNNMDSAIALLNKAEHIKESISELGGLANVYCQQGEVYRRQGQHNKSITTLKKALNLYTEQQKPKGEAEASYQLALNFLEIGRNSEAFSLMNRADSISEALKMLNLREQIFNSLYKHYQKLSVCDKTLEYYTQYIEMRDSVLKQDNIKKILSIQLKDEFDKKITLQNNINEYKINQMKDENRHKTKLFYTSLAILIIVGSVLVLYIHLLRQKEKINKELQQQQKENEEQREELIQQRDQIISILTEIGESIDYAKRIQQAVLPSQKSVAKMFAGYFILNIPRDTVGGDFYCIKEYNGLQVVAAADSTGHGIPGGFMSMLGISLIDEILTNDKSQNPGIILCQLRNAIIAALKQNTADEINTDGMDLSLCIFNPATHILNYAGANLSVMVHTKNQLVTDERIVQRFDDLYELLPNRMPISIYTNMQPFTPISIELQPNDCIYLYSDGYADQFGGPQNKKFGQPAFRKAINGAKNLTMSEQQECFENEINKWKRNAEFQTDDILLMGFKL